MQQARDFREECAVLEQLIDECPVEVFNLKTQFKGWAIGDVIGHLHMFNVAARITLEDDNAFAPFFKPVAKYLAQGKTMLEAQYIWLDGLSGPALFDVWRLECEVTAALYDNADPKHRVKWAGPDMSARSSITARRMETWAHGQEIFDRLGKIRTETDRIKNIAYLGVNTYGWTFVNRKIEVPEPAPYVKLSAPSGAVWEFNAPQTENCVHGSAVEFCQVVAQTRNVADTNLKTMGDTAIRWMALAQCFAGQPNNPPAPGSRHKIEAS